MVRGIKNVPCSTCSQTENVWDPVVIFGEPLKHVITLRGQILVSRKLAIRDDPNIRLRCSRKVEKHLFYRWKHPPCVRSKRPRVCRHNAHTCWNTCARCAGIHRDVLNVHTGMFWMDTRGVFSSVPHNTQSTTTQDTTPHGDRQRQRETTEGEEGTKEKKTRQETRAERREKSEEREDSFSVWWCMAVFCWCCDLSG